MNDRALMCVAAVGWLALVGCTQQPAPPDQAAPQTLATAAATSPNGYGPAFRVSRAVDVPWFDERPVTAALNGKLVFAAMERGTQDPPGLWITDGTAAGTQLLRARLGPLRSLHKGESAFVEFAGVLYFGGAEYDASWGSASGYELWRTDGTPAGTYQVADLNPGPASSWPWELTVARGGLYFVAGTDGEGAGSRRGLYRTDGTAAGTKLVERVAGTNTDSPSSVLLLTAAGDDLFLRWPVPDRGVELHRLAPCPGAPQRECATLVKDLSPPSGSASTFGSWPEMLVALGDRLIFAAEGTEGRGLYRSDGTEAGTSLLTLAAYMGEANGERLSIAAGGYAYLLQYGAGLWRTDGTPEGTLLLAQDHATWQYWMTSALGVVYFWGGDRAAGGYDYLNGERWRTDGTVAGTRVLRDICVGPCSSWAYGEPPLALEPEGRLFFAATSGGAAALWTSDGTEAGTVLLEDFRGITDDRVTSPVGLVRAGELVYFSLPVPGPYTAAYGTYDNELWAVRIDLTDRAPPDVGCPDPIVAEAADPAGAPVEFAVAARDNLTPDVPVSLSRPPGWFPLGAMAVEASATDAAGNTGGCQFTVEVRDTTAPALACPPDLAAEATSADGAPVAFTVSALDAVSPVTVTATPPSGSRFPLGSTAVTASAIDAAGNTAACAFTVTIRDERGPLLACPPDQALEAASPEGSPGGWPDAMALDLVSAVAVTYAPARGSMLSQGSHAVVATGADAAGNLATCGFTVVVRDTTAPVVNCPADVTVTAATAAGAPVTFPAPTSSDAGTPAPAVTLDHASGSQFPLGVTAVRAAAVDAAGNTGSCTFCVEVLEAPVTPPHTFAPGSGAGCAAGPAGLGSLLWIAALLGRRRPRPAAAGRTGPRGARPDS